MIITFVSAVVLIGGVYLYSSSNIQRIIKKSSIRLRRPRLHLRKKAIDLSGEYIIPLVRVIRPRFKKMGKSYGRLITRQKVVATFSTDFKVEGANKLY